MIIDWKRTIFWRNKNRPSPKWPQLSWTQSFSKTLSTIPTLWVQFRIQIRTSKCKMRLILTMKATNLRSIRDSKRVSWLMRTDFRLEIAYPRPLHLFMPTKKWPNLANDPTHCKIIVQNQRSAKVPYLPFWRHKMPITNFLPSTRTIQIWSRKRDKLSSAFFNRNWMCKQEKLKEKCINKSKRPKRSLKRLSSCTWGSVSHRHTKNDFSTISLKPKRQKMLNRNQLRC